MTGVIEEIDREIARLQQARALLSNIDSTAKAPGKKRGRPPGVKKPVIEKPKKRTMSAEGKARIAAAQKKRWAAKKTA